MLLRDVNLEHHGPWQKFFPNLAPELTYLYIFPVIYFSPSLSKIYEIRIFSGAVRHISVVKYYEHELWDF